MGRGRFVWGAALVLAMSSIGCGDDDAGSGSGGTGSSADQPPEGSSREGEGGEEASGDEGAGSGTALPDDLPSGLLLAYAQFEVEGGRVTARPGPARLEILVRRGGAWEIRVVEDGEAAVFHKAMVYDPPHGAAGILTLSGVHPRPEDDPDAELPHEPAVKLWRNTPEGWSAETLWRDDFGGRFNRMRDAEVADVFGDGRPDIVVGTHDQGVVAVVRPPEEAGGEWRTAQLGSEEDTFIHEIEIGDLNDDGKLEVYATPSEPNTLGGGEQRGEVVRFVPSADEGGRTVVANLGSRHAKEILVADVDGDGTDELYVAVEALTGGENGSEIVEPVEIRRYDHDTAPDAGVVIATIDDRFTRFLTHGDVDGDGKAEMVAAAFSSGLWLLEPGTDPRGEWSIESIDRDSSGFEHAAVVADLDEDGGAELYVAADEQGELRRYVWRDGRARRETIHSRQHARSMMTWNIMPVPREVLEVRQDGGE